jgi:hypothetical protein
MLIRSSRKLQTVDAVIEALGGTFKVAELVDLRPQAVSQWRARGQIGKGNYVIMTKALEAKGLVAPASLWGFSKIKSRAG